jgi:predicted O-methyltransferase YrrM
MIDIESGHLAIDRYLAEGYAQVRGMSSRFAAAICGHVIRQQSSFGIAGDVVEIGTFEGRFFIAMGLGLAPNEKALGIDVFDWPDIGVQARFLANCNAHGLASDRFVAWKASTADMQVADLQRKLAGQPARFIHIDGEHSYDNLKKELALAHAVLHSRGVICVDDMLHPGYPTLITAVLDYLDTHPEMRILCVIDREDIVAAAKFLICRASELALYEQDLMATFARFRWALDANMVNHFSMVLTPAPRVADIG